MSRSNLSDAFYFTSGPLPDLIVCVFCHEPVNPTSAVPYFASTGMTLVYRRSADGRLLITCDDGCHPLLSLGLDGAGFVELGRHDFPPIEPVCERCRRAIDRQQWRQVDRLAALGLMRDGARFRSYDEAGAWARGEHEMMRLHRVSVCGKDWVTPVDLIERRDELPPSLRRVRVAVPIGAPSAN